MAPRPRLFHFSDDPGIERFEPRPVLVPSERPAGQEWLNGPLVWAITEERQAAYLFPRDCPRILLWPRPDTTAEDYLYHWFGDPTMPIWTHKPSLFVSGVFNASILASAIHLTVSDSSADGSFATLYANGEAIGRGLVQNGVVDIVPEGPIPIPYPNADFRPQLEVVVDQDGFVPVQVPVQSSPIIIGDQPR